jgi:hypothetical protein
MIGPGKYDDLCTEAREAAEAEGAILIILGGNKGPGFSAQLPMTVDLRIVAALLREVAGQIERSHPLH